MLEAQLPRGVQRLVCKRMISLHPPLWPLSSPGAQDSDSAHMGLSFTQSILIPSPASRYPPPPSLITFCSSRPQFFNNQLLSSTPVYPPGTPGACHARLKSPLHVCPCRTLCLSLRCCCGCPHLRLPSHKPSLSPSLCNQDSTRFLNIVRPLI